jgi:hypothetical protein
MDMDTRGRRVEPREAVEIRVGGLCLGVARIMLVGWSDGCSYSKDGYMVMTDQRSGATPFNRLSAWSSVAPGPHVHRAAVAQGKLHQVAMFPILSRFWCVFVISTSLSFCFLHLSHLSPTPSLELPTYWYRSRGECFGSGCDMRSTILILFPHSCWWNSKELSCSSPIVIFPTWKIKVLPSVTFPTAPRPSISKSRARTTTRLYGSITPAASRSLVYSVRWRIHSIATSTRNNNVHFAVWQIRSRFFWIGWFLGTSTF